jgi:hypothetical protein
MQHVRKKQKNMLASLILWLFKVTELHTPPSTPPKITKYSIAKKQFAEFLHSLRVTEKPAVSLLLGLIVIRLFKHTRCM